MLKLLVYLPILADSDGLITHPEMGNYVYSCYGFQEEEAELVQSKNSFASKIQVPQMASLDFANAPANVSVESNKFLIQNEVLGLDPLKSFIVMSMKTLSELDRGQRLTKTKCGLPVNQEITTSVLTNAQVDQIRNNPMASEDIRKIMSSPFKDISRITDNIFLTGVAGLTIENFKNLRINIIINTTYEYPLIIRPDIVSLRIPVDDDWTDNMEVYFHDISDFLSRATYLNWRTVIHCAAGASRSTTVVLAYLMKWHNLSLKEAFAYVHAARECARPNMGFFEKLIQFERMLRSDSDTQMLEFIIQGVLVKVPNFYRTDFPNLYTIEINKQLRSQGVLVPAPDVSVHSVNIQQGKQPPPQPPPPPQTKQIKLIKKKILPNKTTTVKQNGSNLKNRKTSLIKRKPSPTHSYTTTGTTSKL